MSERNAEPFSIDAILTDVRRMEEERKSAEVSNPAPEPVVPVWSLSDIDKLLGMDDALDGISASDYADRTPAPQPPKEKKAVVGVGRYGQEMFDDIKPVPHKFEPIEEPAPAAEESIDIFSSSALALGAEKPSEVDDTVDEKTKVIGTFLPPESPPDLPASPKPHLVPVEPESEVDGQIVLQGFVADEKAEPIDEEQAEKELEKRRSHQVKNFKLYDFAKKYEPDLPPKKDVFDEPEPGAPKKKDDDPAKEEYRQLKDRMRIGKHLQENRSASFLGTCVLAVIEVVLVILSVVAKNADNDTRAILYAASLLLLSVAAASSISILLSGVRDLFKWKPSCDTAAFFTTLAASAQSAVAFILPGSSGIPCTFCAAAVLSLLMSKLARLFESLAILGNFKFVAFTYAEKLHAIRPFANKSDSFEIGRNLQVGDPNLRYSQKTKFPAEFIRRSTFKSALDQTCKLMIPAALLVSLISALAGWIVESDGIAALSAFAGAICVSMPAGAAITVAIPAYMIMSRLNKQGGMISSLKAASANIHIHALAMDACDLYDQKACELEGYKDYHAIRIDDMLMYAAAMAVESKGPLGDVFLRIFGNPDILPPVKNLIYEEKMGLSAYIRDQSVLLGNRNLLINHSIDPPAKSVEVKYLQLGQRVLYLAIGTKIAAMFVVSYVENDALTPSLRNLESNGIHLVVHAPDCNLTEDFISEGFEMTKGSVQLMGPNAGIILNNARSQESDYAPAELMHNGTAESFVRTMSGAVTLHNIQRIATFIGIIGSAIGWLVAFILMIIGGIGAFSWAFVTLYTLLWTTASTVLGIIQALRTKK